MAGRGSVVSMERSEEGGIDRSENRYEGSECGRQTEEKEMCCDGETKREEKGHERMKSRKRPKYESKKAMR